jgi:hypothetical protein
MLLAADTARSRGHRSSKDLRKLPCSMTLPLGKDDIVSWEECEFRRPSAGLQLALGQIHLSAVV